MNNDLLKRYIDDQPYKDCNKASVLQQANYPMTRLFNARKGRMLSPKNFAVHIC